MQIANYLRATVCNSSNAAFKLALNSPKHTALAQKIISTKNVQAYYATQINACRANHASNSKAKAIYQQKVEQGFQKIDKYNDFLIKLESINSNSKFHSFTGVASSQNNISLSELRNLQDNCSDLGSCSDFGSYSDFERCSDFGSYINNNGIEMIELHGKENLI